MDTIQVRDHKPVIDNNQVMDNERVRGDNQVMGNQGDFRILIDEMKVRGFSLRTIKMYSYQNRRFLEFILKSPRDVNKSDVERYMVMLYDTNAASATRYVILAALKFYYESVLKRRFHLKYPRKENKLAVVLSKDEILRMIDALSNPKHKLLLMLMYGSGLRLSECINVKIEDFDLGRKVLHVKRGKGAKDRVVNLSIAFIDMFLSYTSGKREGFLFSSAHHPNGHITSRAAQNVVKDALRICGITKKAHPHTLRTSYATHLIENGVDVSYVQKLLGHKNLSTTQVYLRHSTSSIASIKSPLDV